MNATPPTEPDRWLVILTTLSHFLPASVISAVLVVAQARQTTWFQVARDVAAAFLVPPVLGAALVEAGVGLFLSFGIAVIVGFATQKLLDRVPDFLEDWARKFLGLQPRSPKNDQPQ
ncbi:hypothetical protein [Caldimonas sp. KR1-144]|uniref:hypothetical protein n=1 Tax=Caldimonas sp. KR1-144 TaxID=3400911 RepID=UPI003C104D2C